MKISENAELNAFLDDIKFRTIDGSYNMASRCVRLLMNIVNDTNWKTANELIEKVKYIGNEINKSDPTEVVPRNMVLRLLKIIRDEYRNVSGEKNAIEIDESLQRMMIEEEKEDYNIHFEGLRESIADNLSELQLELEASADNIASQATEHVYSNEVIMTLGKSKTVEAFLKAAAKEKRKFQVVVAECAPFYTGHQLVSSLTQVGIETILIPDSAIFAMMSKVTKVIIGTHSVMANGGLRALSGSFSLALAAKHYSVPLIVCTAMFKLTPLYLVSHDQVAFNRFSSPHEILPFEHDYSSNTEVVNPVFDYVPPELVTLLVSNIGGNSPSYIYRLLREIYNIKDYVS